MGLWNWLRQRLRHPAPEPPQPVGFVIVDVETTGLFAGRDRVVEIATIRTDPAGRILDEWSTLINPDGPVGAVRIHGIGAAEVRTAPRFGDIIGELNQRFAGRALVAHNAAFDLAFLRTEYARAGWEFPAAPYLCTLEASRVYLPELARRRLSDCCRTSGVEVTDAHSALGDARATAALFARYLDPHVGRPPVREHLALPASAVQTLWPPVPYVQVAVKPRGVRARADVAPPGLLWRLLDDLPLAAAVEDGAPQAATAYLEMLFEVLEDGVLTEAEALSLVEVAAVYSLTRTQVEAAHRGFLLALAHRAVEDGKVTRDERAELLATANMLGVADAVVKTVLDEARTAWDEHRGLECRPLPADWSYGPPLYVGEAVVFTGCDHLTRARLEGRAQAAGLRVTSAVSGKTAVLVTDGADPLTTKAAAARERGTRVVTPTVFAHLVNHVQPAFTTTEGGNEA